MRKHLFACLLICLACLRSFGQDNTAVKNAVEKLKTFSGEHITEKAYLHFDKPFYAAGDTIYFKAYVTASAKHLLSSVSGVLHVDLINTNNKTDQSIKLQLVKGVGWGDFALPDSLPKGNYRIRAYTRWMRNDGEDVFFNKTIPIGAAANVKVPENSTERKTLISTKPDLQFFAEGGELIAGLPSKIAFKAVGVNGLGIAVNGVVIDNTGTETAKFTTSHLGMGYFYLKPEAGKTYQAKVTYNGGVQDVVNLPQTSLSGIALKIDNYSLDKVAVEVVANEGYFAANRDKQVNLLVYSGGVATIAPVKLDSAVINLAILKRRLHSGITTLTLFSDGGEPLSERLVFIQNPDQLKLSVNSDKTTYAKRENIHLNINALTRADSVANGHFSVSVIDESLVPVDENAESTIFNYLLLTSDLKGYVEQPNYYFTNISDKTRTDLDLVMLTHGYRRFQWKTLLADGYPAVAYQPENSLEITGTAKNAFGRPLVKGSVSLISLQRKGFTSVNTDDKGRFRFGGLLFTDTIKLMLQAVKANGKNTTQLTYDIEKPLPVLTSAAPVTANELNEIIPAYLENRKRQYDQDVKFGAVKGILLKEVQIRQRKKEENDYPSSSIMGPGHADQVIHRKELAQIGGSVATSLDGRLRGIQFNKPQNADGGIPYLRGVMPASPMLIVIDGIEQPIGTGINIINLNTIETVEVLRFGSASIYGVTGGNGAIVITTRQGGQDSNDIAAVGVLPITVPGFYRAREFYAPKYDVTNINLKDLRSTIYWKPEVTTDKDGNASFDYYNADGTGSYRVVIEGIDDKGNLGRQVYRYKVE